MPEQLPLTTYDLDHIKETVFEDQYFTVLLNGNVQFHDPLTQEPLEAGCIPPSVTQTPDLAQGIDYLRQSGSEGLTAQLFLATHGGAQDFTLAQKTYGKHLDAVPHLGVETSWTMSQPNTPPTLAEAVPDLLHSSPRRKEFQQAQLNWLKSEQKLPLFCDITDGDTPQSNMNTAINYLWDEIWMKAADRADTPAQQNAAKIIAECIYQSVRQSAIVARLGYWGLQLENAGQKPDQLNLMAGSWHIGSALRLQLLGVHTAIHRTPEPKDTTAAYQHYGRMRIQSSLAGKASKRFLSAKRP